MPNDQPVAAPTPSPVTVSPPSAQDEPQPKTSRKRQDIYEIVMLGAGVITIFSLLNGNVLLLKIAAAVFLLVAVVAIVRSITTPKPIVFNQPSSSMVAEKPRSMLRTVTKILVIIALIPLIGYGAMIIFFVILMATGGGSF